MSDETALEQTAVAAKAGEQPAPRFVCSYLYENHLLSGLAYLQASGGRKTLMYVLGVAAIAGGIICIFTGGDWSWLGWIIALLGIFLLWGARNLYHIMAQSYIENMQKAEGDESRRRRYIEMTSDELAITLPDGSTRTFPFKNLGEVKQDREMYVLMFGKDGIVVPRDSFLTGTVEEFEGLLRELGKL